MTDDEFAAALLKAADEIASEDGVDRREVLNRMADTVDRLRATAKSMGISMSELYDRMDGDRLLREAQE